MEYFINKDKTVAYRIFDLGLKSFGDEPRYILSFLDHLSHLTGRSVVQYCVLYPLSTACTLSLYCEIVGIFVLYPKVSCVPPVLCTPLSSCLLSHFVWSVGTFVLCPPVLSFCSPRGQQHSCAVWEISLFYEPWKDKVSVCVCGCGCGCVWVCGCVGVCWLPD